MTAVGRPPSAGEQGVLAHMLSADFVGAAELRSQLPLARVTRTWSSESISIDLAVPADAAPAPLPDGPAPVDAWVYDVDGGVLGTLLVWIKDGRLSALEYGWVTDTEPGSWPPPSAIQLKA